MIGGYVADSQAWRHEVQRAMYLVTTTMMNIPASDRNRLMRLLLQTGSMSIGLARFHNVQTGVLVRVVHANIDYTRSTRFDVIEVIVSGEVSGVLSGQCTSANLADLSQIATLLAWVLASTRLNTSQSRYKKREAAIRITTTTTQHNGC